MTIPEYIHLLRTTKHPQGVGNYIHHDKCCALGLIAKTLDPDTECFSEALNETRLELGLIDCKLSAIGVNVVHLNDFAKLTFHQIADIVEEAYERHNEA